MPEPRKPKNFRKPKTSFPKGQKALRCGGPTLQQRSATKYITPSNKLKKWEHAIQ